MNLDTTISLLFDVNYSSLPLYMGLASKERRRLQERLIEVLFKTTPFELMKQAAWKPKLEAEVDAVTDEATGRLSHGVVRAAMEAALVTLDPLMRDSRKLRRSDAHGEMQAHGGDGGSSSGAEPHCIRWVLIDGRWVAEYNYAVELVEPDPNRPGESRSSDEIPLTDHLGGTGHVLANMHIVLRYDITPEVDFPDVGGPIP